jgi:hypothetical protein
MRRAPVPHFKVGEVGLDQYLKIKLQKVLCFFLVNYYYRNVIVLPIRISYPRQLSTSAIHMALAASLIGDRKFFHCICFLT